MLLVTGTAITAAVRRHQHLTRLTEVARTGLADARLALSEHRYSAAQSRLREVRGQLAGEPTLMAQFGPPLERFLEEAKKRIRVARFQKLAEQARASVVPLMADAKSSTPDEFNRARKLCNHALSVLKINSRDDWDDSLDGIAREDAAQIKQTAAELLVFLAFVEYESRSGPGSVPRAISRLDKAESIFPRLRAIYLYRSKCYREMDKLDAARGDEERADSMESVTALDHFLQGMQLFRQESYARALSEFEASLVLKVDDPWAWYMWGSAQAMAEWRNLDRAHWAANVVVNLRPDLAVGWIERGRRATQLGDSETAVQDLTRALELTNNTKERFKVYSWRGVARTKLGQFDAALADLNQAHRLAPQIANVHAVNNLLDIRQWCHMLRGDVESARADARRVLDLIPKGAGLSDFFFRANAFRRLERWPELIQTSCAWLEVEARPYMVKNAKRNLKKACAEIQSAIDLDTGDGTASDFFLLAMARWHLGHKDKARNWYEKAIRWMQQNRPDDKELHRLRAEAENLMGIQKQKSEARDQKSEPVESGAGVKPVAVPRPMPE